jgi:magnesium-transporting ATPase (P-type)
MLPQPNFGRDREPAKGAPESEAEADPNAKPRKIFRLQIAMWVQIVSSVLAGNFFIWSTITYRSASLDDLRTIAEDNDMEEPAKAAQEAFEFYQSTNFLVSNVTVGAITLLAAIIAALCVLRFKSRLKVVRWWAVGTTAVLFIVGMLMSPQLSILVAPWIFASVLALWWLFSSDVRWWMSESQAKSPKGEKEEQEPEDA